MGSAAAAQAPAPTPRPPRKADAMDAVGQSFKGAMAAARRLQGRDTHHPDALSHAQYQVLFELLRSEELTVGGLATVAGVSAASMTQMVDRLADGGLVERARSAADRRVVGVRLTQGGRDVCERRRAAVEPLWRATLSGFSTAELLAAAAVLDRLTGLFEQLGSS